VPADAAAPAPSPEDALPAEQDESLDGRIRRANAQAKRYRLQLREAEQRVADLEDEMASLNAGHEAAVAEQMARHRQELRGREEAARQREVEALRLAELARHGLSPEDATFITGDDAESIGAQVAQLASRLQETALSGRASVGNAGARRASGAGKIVGRIAGAGDNPFDPQTQMSSGGGFPKGED
jgi:hypothetical protein